MFKIGDVVVYSATGVCRISDICEKNFGSVVSQYYVLTPLMQKTSTVFVPVNNEQLTRKMHRALSKSDFEGIFAKARSKQVLKLSTEGERRERFAEIINSGDRLLLIMMICELVELKAQQTMEGRRLHLADERLLNAAGTLLFEEISYVFEIEQNDAQDFLEAQIR